MAVTITLSVLISIMFGYMWWDGIMRKLVAGGLIVALVVTDILAWAYLT